MRITVVVMLVTACGSVGSPTSSGAGPSGSDSGMQSGGGGSGDGGSTGGGSGGGSGIDSGTGSDPLPEYRSGTRIKMQVLTSADGAKEFRGWFDTERNEPCGFALAADGVMRCLPSAAAFSLFTNSSCSTPAVQLPPATAACTTYVTTSQSLTTTCPATFQYGAIFPAVIATPTPQVFAKSGTSCIATTVISGWVVLVASGPEIPPTTFQSATLDIE